MRNVIDDKNLGHGTNVFPNYTANYMHVHTNLQISGYPSESLPWFKPFLRCVLIIKLNQFCQFL